MAENGRWQGRINKDCQILQDGSAQWQWASDLYPELDTEEQPEPPGCGIGGGLDSVSPRQELIEAKKSFELTEFHTLRIDGDEYRQESATREREYFASLEEREPGLLAELADISKFASEHPYCLQTGAESIFSSPKITPIIFPEGSCNHESLAKIAPHIGKRIYISLHECDYDSEKWMEIPPPSDGTEISISPLLCLCFWGSATGGVPFDCVVIGDTESFDDSILLELGIFPMHEREYACYDTLQYKHPDFVAPLDPEALDSNELDLLEQFLDFEERCKKRSKRDKSRVSSIMRRLGSPALAAQEWVYVALNESMPGLCKIGMTTRDPNERVKELSGSTGVPTPFLLAYSHPTFDGKLAEKYIHDTLDEYRKNDDREFFIIDAEEASRIVRDVCEQLG